MDWGVDEKREEMTGRQRLKVCVMEKKKKGYIIAAGLCVNVVSTPEAICCDKDKILTLEWRKCSVSRTKTTEATERETQRERVHRGMRRERERETFFITREKEIRWGIHLSCHLLAEAVGQNSRKRSPPFSTWSSLGCVILLLSGIHRWAWGEHREGDKTIADTSLQ